jgi:lipopolysaccharide/colanic/teichoic acid biosynthesis glycosyltransferase
MLESTEAISPLETMRRGRQTPTLQARRVLDVRAFRSVLDHERARSDRSGQSFALVVFTLREQDGPYELRRTAELLAIRLRSIDEIGWLSQDRLGLLLPYSLPESAWKLADDFTADYPLSGTPPACEVFAYPTNWPVLEDGEEDDRDDDPPDRPTGQLEPFFARRLPWWKRLMDLLGALAGLMILAPLLLLVAIAVKLTSRGPAIFSQWRSGLGGRRFRMFKFRTMVSDAEQLRAAYLLRNEQDGPAFKITNDPRVTWLGRWLRITSVDEFPQLWNVLRGEMSLVGPRPLPCHEAAACEMWQRRRLDVTPGLTCLWQTRGRPRTSFALWMRQDLQYNRMQSFWTDLKLILLTIPTVLKNRADR